MKTRNAYNPYLPFWETVPDGEPHVFDGRVYIFGSHDKLGGDTFCPQDYVVWSAPVDDLGNWRCEGVSYRAVQDPINGAPYTHILPDGTRVENAPLPEAQALDIDFGHPHYLYAPDVCQGPDGRFYLYYSLDFVSVISVAVADRPEGPYEFLDYCLTPEGKNPTPGIRFDPAILSDETGNYLYYGSAPDQRFPGQEDLDIPGAMMVRLADDMHTVISDPVCIANGCDTAKGTSFEEFPFFEASSIRHFGDWYYFVYSPLQGNELCYAMAKSPVGPFTYKGVIISNGDIGYQGRTKPVMFMGNNHGGLVQIENQSTIPKDVRGPEERSEGISKEKTDVFPDVISERKSVKEVKTYIFWHRQTHGTQFSRQGCAEEVEILPDGTIPQVEVTSCGLNGGSLPAKGVYPAYIYSYLTKPDPDDMWNAVMPGPGANPDLAVPKDWPVLAEEPFRPDRSDDERTVSKVGNDSGAANESVSVGNPSVAANISEDKRLIEHSGISLEKGLRSYVANLRKGAVIGFKYFDFDGSEAEIHAVLRGNGTMELHLDDVQGPAAAVLTRSESGDSAAEWIREDAGMQPVKGTHAVYLVVTEGNLDITSFSFS